MKVSFLLISALVLLTFSACTTSRRLTSNVKPSQVTDVQYIEPFAYISVIYNGNQPRLNDSLSNLTRSHLEKVTQTFNNQIPITGKISVSDPIVRKRLEKEIETLCLTANEKHRITGLAITPVIDSLLTNRGKRFGLITVSAGYTRTQLNFDSQLIHESAMMRYTFGHYTSTPIGSNSQIYVMIVDSKEKNIAFFRRSFVEDLNPVSEKVLSKQMKDIFSGYLLTKK